MAKLPKSLKPQRLAADLWFDIPVPEASALALWRGPGGPRVVAAGDEDNTVAIGTLVAPRELSWNVVDLAGIPGSGLAVGPSQIEAIDSDSVGVVVLVTEDPPVAVVVSVEQRAALARIDLAVRPGGDLAAVSDDPSSRGESVLLLRDGHLLVVKEKRPAMLVELGPPGDQPGGVQPDRFLAAGEAWQPPDGDTTFHDLACWPLGGAAAAALPDVSDAALLPDGSLVLLSDQGRRIAQVGTDLPPAGGPLHTVERVWQLPGSVKKPEGLVVLPDGRALVCLDHKGTEHNGILLRPALSSG